eukprot:COSAG01_NODE_50667_length_361_cov_1.141221_1_plen_24_part_01
MAAVPVGTLPIGECDWLSCGASGA